jgi:hypothetical protein
MKFWEFVQVKLSPSFAIAQFTSLCLLRGWRIILELLEISFLGEKLLASQERFSSMGLFVVCWGKAVGV